MQVIILHHATIATGGQVSLGSKIIKVHDYQYKECQSTGPVQWSTPILVHSAVCLQNWPTNGIINMALHVLLANCGIKVYSG